MTFHRASLIKSMALLGISCVAISGSYLLVSNVHASNVNSRFQIDDHRLSEASGIAVSRIDEQLLWLNNDSGNANTIYAVTTEGELRTSITLAGVENRDWEDLASFTFKGKPYLLVADVGDNDEEWTSYNIYIIPEPDLSYRAKTDIVIEPTWHIEFSYPDGSHDSEAVAVDVQRERIMLLTKRDDVPKLFELPLVANGKMVATDLGEIYPIPDASGKGFSFVRLFNYGNRPTAMDISADGKNLAILTYEGVYLYQNSSENPWDGIFSKPPIEIELPNMKQAEAIGFDQSGQYLYVTSEKVPSPLYKLRVPAALR
ncbi:hypothetical protein ACWU4D_09580 [Vibrio sp. WJH972]